MLQDTQTSDETLFFNNISSKDAVPIFILAISLYGGLVRLKSACPFSSRFYQ